MHSLELLVDALHVKVFPTRAISGAAAAADFISHASALLAARAPHGRIRVIFAAAPSQREMLDALCASRTALDWDRVDAFHMDEYLVPPSNPCSFSHFLSRHCWDVVRPGAVHVLRGDSRPIEAECVRYAALLAAAPIDVCLLGIGENGHLAFNDPPPLGGADFSDPQDVKRVTLDDACRTQQVRDGAFASFEDAPSTALTLTLPCLLRAERIFCVVPGPAKRAAVAATLCGPIEVACPASALRRHAHASLYLDEGGSFDRDAAGCAALLRGCCAGGVVVTGLECGTGRVLEVGVGAGGRIASLARWEGVAATANAPPSLLILAPGLVDLQVNGYLGVDFNAAPTLSAAQLRSVATALLAHGVTSFLPTLISNSSDALLANFTALAAACEADEVLGASVLGFHLEGPFVSPLDGYRGAHDAAHCRAPSWALFSEWQAAAKGRIRLITVAPELPGAIEFIRAAVASGVAVALGHTAATGEEIAAAKEAGAKFATHLGNGLPAMLPRHTNTLWEMLGADGIVAAVIADGFHLPSAVLRVVVRVKGLGGVVLVSDAAPLAGCAPGEYNSFVGGGVVLEDAGRLRLASDAKLLAGSTLTLDGAVGNMAPLLVAAEGGGERGQMRALKLAWDMGSCRPRGVLGEGGGGGLALGEPADIVGFEAAWEGGKCSVKVRKVWKGGVERH